jgi:hypothetical protein
VDSCDEIRPAFSHSGKGSYCWLTEIISCQSIQRYSTVRHAMAVTVLQLVLKKVMVVVSVIAPDFVGC